MQPGLHGCGSIVVAGVLVPLWMNAWVGPFLWFGLYEGMCWAAKAAEGTEKEGSVCPVCRVPCLILQRTVHLTPALLLMLLDVRWTVEQL